jgi:hypothetical protein
MGCLYSNETIEAAEKAGANTDAVIPLSIPMWLWKALFRALGRAFCIEVDSWDDVFGPPVQTKDGHPARGKSRLALRRKMELQFDIYWRVEELTAQGKTVDKKLFEHIAKEHGIGRARAEKIYYENRAMVELVTCSLRGQPLRD